MKYNDETWMHFNHTNYLSEKTAVANATNGHSSPTGAMSIATVAIPALPLLSKRRSILHTLGCKCPPQFRGVQKYTFI